MRPIGFSAAASAQRAAHRADREPRPPRLEEMITRRSTAAITAALSWPVFFLLRTNVLNQDGNMLTPKLERDVPLLGAHLSHDELLELFLHSKVWEYTHRWWGWSVVFSYQVVSCTAGAVFIYVLLRLSSRLAPAEPGCS
jgi:hypothetical protein